MGAFTRFTRRTAAIVGHPMTLVAAVALVVAWFIVGLVFGMTDTWQLVANTTTTIATTLLVIIVQSTQNRDTTAIERKLDEMVRVHDRADDGLIGIEKRDG